MQLVSVDTAAADAAAAADLFAHSALPYIDNQLESIHNMKEVSSDPREQRQTCARSAVVVVAGKRCARAVIVPQPQVRSGPRGTAAWDGPGR